MDRSLKLSGQGRPFNMASLSSRLELGGYQLEKAL